MAKPTVRASVDIPATRQLILHSIERVVKEIEPRHPPRRLSLEMPLIPADGRKPFNLTNEQIYELIEFP